MYNGVLWFELMLVCMFRDNFMLMFNWYFQFKELVECINKVLLKVLVLGGVFVEVVQLVCDQLIIVEYFIVVDVDELFEGMIVYELLIWDSWFIFLSGKLGMVLKIYSGGIIGMLKYINIDWDWLILDLVEVWWGVFKEEVIWLGLMQILVFYFYKIGKIWDLISNNICMLILGLLYYVGVQIVVLLFFFGGIVVFMSKFDFEFMFKFIQDECINWIFVVLIMFECILVLFEVLKF